jgi:hypothetical protein
VGFTRLSATMSALRAVQLLNDIFSRVETAAERYGSVWKVRKRRPPEPENPSNTCNLTACSSPACSSDAE